MIKTLALRLSRRLHYVAVSLVVLSLLGTSLSFPGTSRASISDCSGAISPHSVAPGSTTNFQLTLTNDDPSEDIQWIKILRPSGDFTIQNVTASGWSASVASDEASLTGQALSPSDSLVITVQAQAANVEAEGANWSVYASDSPDGSGSSSCTNDTAVEITGGQPFALSNVAVSAITATTAQVTWSTNRPANSRVDYGFTASYGLTATGDASDFTTSHALTLTGLSPSTGYHYRVVTSTDTNQTLTSADGTFMTAAAPPTPTGDTGGSPTVNVPGAVVKPVPTEKVPPTISLITNLTRPFSQPPTITGVASDNEAVALIEYSTDGGTNWQPVTTITQPNRRKPRDLAFSFTTVFPDDGDFVIVARATDTSGNSTTTPPTTLVIDRLPPQTGPLVLAYGSQPLQPNAQGVVEVMAGSDYRITTSAVGGPNSLTLDARPLTGATTSPAASFTLVQSAATGLWSGLLSFKTGGAYQLVARGLDGAGNRTERAVMAINVLAPGRITEAGTARPLAKAQVVVHYREPASGTWQVWDGRAYRQTNPQTVGSGSTYSLVVPRGTYYLEVKAPLHYSFVSNIFTTERPQAITAPISLRSIPHLTLGPLTISLPNIVLRAHDLPAPPQSAAPTFSNPIIGKSLPDFSLPTTAGTTQTALGLTGKPTLITILSTWSPDAQAQVPQLADAQTNPDINITPVFSQQHLPLVTAYLSGAGYRLTALVDADGILVTPLMLGPVPEHIFIDATGKVKKIMTGVMTKDELLLQLGGL